MKRLSHLLSNVLSTPVSANDAARTFALRLHFFWGLVLVLHPAVFRFPIYRVMAQIAPAHAWGFASLGLWLCLLVTAPKTLPRIVAIIASLLFWLAVAVAASGRDVNTGTAVYLVIVWTVFECYKTTIKAFFDERAGLSDRA